jgi:sec-independent protein translocase protein TatA
MASIGLREILLITLFVVLLFGAKKIPQMFRGLGEGLREFKKASRGDDKTNPNPTNG